MGEDGMKRQVSRVHLPADRLWNERLLHSGGLFPSRC